MAGSAAVLAMSAGVVEPAPRALDARRAEVDRRHALLAAWLTQEGHSGLVLAEPDDVAWATAGGRIGWQPIRRHDSPILFFTARQRCVVGPGHQTARFFEEEIDGLGFQLKDLPPWQPARGLLRELVGESSVASDVPSPGLADAREAMARLRLKVAEFDQPRLRWLAQILTHSLEATCRMIEPGHSEREVAAHLAHRLLRFEVSPREVAVLPEPLAGRSPRPTPTERPVERGCTILATANWRGLSATASRTVSFGNPDEETRRQFQAAAMIAGTLLRFTQDGEPMDAVLKRGLRIYEKLGFDFAWREAPQGHWIGSAAGGTLNERSSASFEAGHAVAWTPQVGGLTSTDGVLVGADGSELLGFFETWPSFGVSVRGATVARPDILIR